MAEVNISGAEPFVRHAVDEIMKELSSKRLDVEGGQAGWRPESGEPQPNRTDAAWERLLKLRDEARALGIEVDEAWPIQRLIEEIATRRA